MRENYWLWEYAMQMASNARTCGDKEDARSWVNFARRVRLRRQ